MQSFLCAKNPRNSLFEAPDFYVVSNHHPKNQEIATVTNHKNWAVENELNSFRVFL
jgi:hypothetical protein